MDIAGFQQDHLARRALMAGAPQVKPLYALLGEPDGVGIMPMRVVSVAFEMGAQALDPGSRIEGQINPIGGRDCRSLPLSGADSLRGVITITETGTEIG
ncbi:hypothetical protein A6D6_03957 [Alcanivorax xiamenensis]|uniref:Uncharacterized protein n=1 Tax=Alcanivorax xiamenensis TaxID=1177156 RepID=A0ABQ6Y2W9_9GAMM|nr:hypothetical protein A6D6_03957 [Alcanivorax xiamenensis]